MGFERFEQEYEKREQELIVLRHQGGGGSKYDGFWMAQANFLAYTDAETGVLCTAEGRLVWPVTEEERKSGAIFNRFKEETIYRVRARALIDKTVPAGRLPSFYNRFYVTEVLEENARCPVLEELLAAYQTPVILQDALLGELMLNKQFGCFDGKIPWSSGQISISLDVDKNNEESWTKARTAMQEMVKAQDKWDKEMRAFAAEKLTSLANDWQMDEDYEEDYGEDGEEAGPPEITKQDFANRISLQTLAMASDGTFSAYYDDGDMFLGHSVTVYGNLRTGLQSANMEG